MEHSFLIIEGNIGAGKTSLATRLSSELGSRLILEQFEDNSFLPKFYADPDKYAFPLEMSFLADRYQQLKSSLVNMELFEQQVVADYIIDKSLIFSRKTLGEDEYKLYARLFTIIKAALPKPDLLVYLHRPVAQLLDNISSRGRDYEQEISAEYLKRIQDSYFDFFRSRPGFPILIIDCQGLDFVHREDDYQELKKCLGKPYPEGISYYPSIS